MSKHVDYTEGKMSGILSYDFVLLMNGIIIHRGNISRQQELLGNIDPQN
jgi:hypothetical protein